MLYLNVIVQILFDIARILVCFKFVHGFFFVASFHVCQCEFGFPIDCNLRLVGIGTVLCQFLRLSLSLCCFFSFLWLVGFADLRC